MIPKISPDPKRVSSNAPKGVRGPSNVRLRVKPMGDDRIILFAMVGGFLFFLGITGQCGGPLFVIGGLVILFYVGYQYFSPNSPRNILINSGSLVNAIVVSSRVEKKKDWTGETKKKYWVVVGFEAENVGKDPTSVKLDLDLNRNLFNKLKPEQEIKIRYAKQNPRIAYLDGKGMEWFNRSFLPNGSEYYNKVKNMVPDDLIRSPKNEHKLERTPNQNQDFKRSPKERSKYETSSQTNRRYEQPLEGGSKKGSASFNFPNRITPSVTTFKYILLVIIGVQILISIDWEFININLAIIGNQSLSEVETDQFNKFMLSMVGAIIGFFFVAQPILASVWPWSAKNKFRQSNSSVPAEIIYMKKSRLAFLIEFAIPMHQVVVRFWAGKAETTSPDVTLVVRVRDKTYRKLKDEEEIRVRYATEDPRIMLIEGVEEMVF